MNSSKQIPDPKYPMKVQTNDDNGTTSLAYFYK